MTADTPTGLTVFHVRLTLQLFCPAAMMHDEGEAVRVPVIVGAWHVLPFQVVPDAQLDVGVVAASCSWLL